MPPSHPLHSAFHRTDKLGDSCSHNSSPPRTRALGEGGVSSAARAAEGGESAAKARSSAAKCIAHVHMGNLWEAAEALQRAGGDAGTVQSPKMADEALSRMH